MTDQTAMTLNYAHLVERWDLLHAKGEAGKPEGIDWLHDALAAAIKLEFSTIPPYFCALWSIKDQGSSVANAIRQVVQEEMLHMALACNMLVAIGGTPRIADPDFAPVYPGHLAGGVHDDLVVSLSGLTDDVVRGFMVIELPERTMQDETERLKKASQIPSNSRGHETIGQFYDRMEQAFRWLDPPLLHDRQISGPLSWFPVHTLAEVHEAIALIKHQGEGSDAAPLEYSLGMSDKPELAHFYRFLEIHARQRVYFDEDAGMWDLHGDLPWPETYPMAPVPTGGYPTPETEISEEVAGLLNTFDENYSRLLCQLEGLWASGDQGHLIHAIETMFSLQGPARALMQIPIPGTSGQTYGPCFRYLKETT